ncbi:MULTISPECIES: phage tail protein [Pseudomonas]|jgi:microcystin-dependent protein|uniref:phage tail protein n=1 Tax=Pseudomonas TaxID=286 RepID=UPI00054B4A01|nr:MULTISPECIES: tail fiber protein [Pseudomonas]KAF6687050.1 tail fiber protein [Pseudomonas sp. EKM23D]MBB4815628.1 microcystin-dependent protein [Pseudomonas rhodesiae]MDN6866235.1 tail fiber protein [Pseudomonas rhodesiae]PHN37519.1 phage tail protein [Pseudomonas sp. ICMP 564]POA53639.1 phage tail protein [Pseudomonas sp. GW531-R1]
MEVFIGTIQSFAFNYAPNGWALCNGQIVAVQQNAVLFSLIGTFYGGNGQSTFQLPNLQSRVPVGMGQGTGLSPHAIGAFSGSESVTLLAGNLPAHTHGAGTLAGNTTVQLTSVVSNPVTVPTPTNAYIGASGPGPGSATIYSDQQGANPVPLKGVTSALSGETASAGQSQAVGIMNPYLAINFSIALEGLYPSRP